MYSIELKRNINNNYDKQKQSILGKISIAISILNIMLCIFIFWALYSYINRGPLATPFDVNLLQVQVQIINIGDKLQMLAQPIGIIIGILGFFEKNTKKATAIAGVLINGLTLIWTLILLYTSFINI